VVVNKPFSFATANMEPILSFTGILYKVASLQKCNDALIEKSRTVCNFKHLFLAYSPSR
ncbi:MAG: hypothetical protein ACI9OO_001832, partial [Bacteroidia bacterium]